MTRPNPTMSAAAQQVFALFEPPQDCEARRTALCWALAFAMREKRGGQETVSAPMLAARAASPGHRMLPDILAHTRAFGYVCDAVDRAPTQFPDAAFPLIALTVDGSSLLVSKRAYREGKAEYTVHRVEATGRHFGATLDENELMAMSPGLTLVLLPNRPRRADQRSGEMYVSGA